MLDYVTVKGKDEDVLAIENSVEIVANIVRMLEDRIVI